MRVSADSADHARGGAFALRDRRAAAALADSNTVTRSILCAAHMFVDEHNAARDSAVWRGFERGEIWKAHDIRREAAFWCGGRAAERGGDHGALKAWRDDVRFFAHCVPVWQ